MGNRSSSRRLCRWSLLLVAFALAPVVRGQTIPRFNGELSTVAWSDAKVSLGTVRIRYHFSTLMQEPLEKYDVLFEGADQPARIQKISFRAKVTSGGAANRVCTRITPA